MSLGHAVPTLNGPWKIVLISRRELRWDKFDSRPNLV